VNAKLPILVLTLSTSTDVVKDPTPLKWANTENGLTDKVEVIPAKIKTDISNKAST
jgi:hypothetical protein